MCVCSLPVASTAASPRRRGSRSSRFRATTAGASWWRVSWSARERACRMTRVDTKRLCVHAARHHLTPHRGHTCQVNQIDRKLTKMLNALFPETDGEDSTIRVADKVGLHRWVGGSLVARGSRRHDAKRMLAVLLELIHLLPTTHSFTD